MILIVLFLLAFIVIIVGYCVGMIASINVIQKKAKEEEESSR